ncbi:hypothetical protein [Microcoleus sp. PH2017_25_DOB_D_A]|nr:hypothetical protein [Microcoleus sp. PH2017_25_DOB_D_A]
MGNWELGIGNWALGGAKRRDGASGFYNIGIKRKGRFTDRFCHQSIIP